MSEPTPPRPWGRRPLPGRADWRRALGVYVAGRSRAITHDRKRSLARASDETDANGAADDASPIRGADRMPESRFGVAIPGQLAFHRNAGNWRDRLAGSEAHDRD